ncbi:MAG: hypothetical protein AAF353_12505, partial [Pseudomonadota bacterium]
RFWQMLNLDYREQALAWNSESTPEDWQYVEGWHQQASESTGIRQADEDLEKYQRAFEDACRRAPQLRHFFEHHRVFYEKLKQHSLMLVDDS